MGGVKHLSTCFGPASHQGPSTSFGRPEHLRTRFGPRPQHMFRTTTQVPKNNKNEYKMKTFNQSSAKIHRFEATCRKNNNCSSKLLKQNTFLKPPGKKNLIFSSKLLEDIPCFHVFLAGQFVGPFAGQFVGEFSGQPIPDEGRFRRTWVALGPMGLNQF